MNDWLIWVCEAYFEEQEYGLLIRYRSGRRIVELQASLHMIAGSATTPEHTLPDRWGRKPFKHPALEGLAGLTSGRKKAVLEKKRTAQLASKYGLTSVLRWKPKLVCYLREI